MPLEGSLNFFKGYKMIFFTYLLRYSKIGNIKGYKEGIGERQRA